MRPPKLNPQNKAILEWLLSGKTITALEALNALEIRSGRLAARIEELRKAGWPIITKMIKTPSDKFVGQYSLQVNYKKEDNGYLPFNAEGLPCEIKSLDQWCCWKLQPREKGKAGKVPVMTSNPLRHASVNDSSTWSSFDNAVSRYSKGDVDGVSFILTNNDPFSILDLDDVIQDIGTLKRSAVAMVKALNSYTEVSAGGSGLHVIVKASLNREGIHNKAFELYDRSKVMALTGSSWGNPKPIREGQEVIALLSEIDTQAKLKKQEQKAKAYRPRRPSCEHREFAPRTDDEVLRVMFDSKHGIKIKDLWNGNYGDDQSVADLSLCFHLAYWTNRDIEQMDRLFRQSALMRKKWERRDYRMKTLRKAIEGANC